MERTLETLVSDIFVAKKKSVCPVSSGGCGLRHFRIEDDVISGKVGEYVGWLYDTASVSYSKTPRHVAKNHIVSKSVFGKGNYKVTDDSFLKPVIVSSASKYFTVDAKFGDVFEIMCGYIESMWGNRKGRFFDINTHEINSSLFRYMSRDYLELKILSSLVYAIHKVRSDHKDMFLDKELTVEAMSREFISSFNSVSWFITTHPSRERIMNIPLIPRDITKFAYGKDEFSEHVGEVEFDETESSLIPVDHYGYLETVKDGFGFLGALFLFHNTFNEKGRKLYRETITSNSEMWRGKECEKSGEFRIFYLKEDLTYKVAVTDCLRGRKGWVEKPFKVDVKRLSKVLNEYERLYIDAGHGAVKKSFSTKNTTHGKSVRKRRRK